MKSVLNGEILGRFLLFLIFTFSLANAFNVESEQINVERDASTSLYAQRLDGDAIPVKNDDQFAVGARSISSLIDASRPLNSRRSLNRAGGLAQQRAYRSTLLGKTAILCQKTSPSARFYFGAPGYSLKSRDLSAPIFLLLQKLRD